MLLLLLVENMKYGIDVRSSSTSFIPSFAKIGQNFPKLKRGTQEQSGALFSFIVK